MQKVHIYVFTHIYIYLYMYNNIQYQIQHFLKSNHTPSINKKKRTLARIFKYCVILHNVLSLLIETF